MNSAVSAPELAAIREHMIVDGQPFTDGQGRLPVYNPATGKQIAEQIVAGPAQVDTAVRAAHRAFESSEWHDMMPATRERLILKLADRLEAEGETLSRLETLNQGKLLTMSQMLEVGAGAQWLRYMAGWATKISGQTLQSSFGFPPVSSTRHTPAASRSVWLGPSCPGTSLCLWPSGRFLQPWLPAVQ